MTYQLALSAFNKKGGGMGAARLSYPEALRTETLRFISPPLRDI